MGPAFFVRSALRGMFRAGAVFPASLTKR